MGKARDSAYFESRMKRDHPKIYAELKAGHFPSVRQAAAAAGLIHLPTRLGALKREWKRAGRGERRDFVLWLKGKIPASAPTPSPTTRPIIDRDGHLRPAVIKFIKDWTVAKRVSPGRVMKEMGFSNFDYTMSRALGRREPLRLAVILSLGGWLAREGFS
jgi:hypothetical protein